MNCHERDWTLDQASIFGKNSLFDWKEIYQILNPYFDNSLPRLSQVMLADINGKLLHNMIPLYDKIHKFFEIKNISPFLSKDVISYSTQIPINQKYNSKTNTGKLILIQLLKNNNIYNLISQKKQGFSVNTLNLWKNHGKKIAQYYLKNGRVISDGYINKLWIDKYLENDDIDVRIVNKLLGILAFEIWYRLFITKEIKSSEKLCV